MSGTVASVVGLTQGYGRHTVLSDFALDMNVGVIGLLGPNGAGKTTLLRTVATVTPPQRGVVRILGNEITTERQALAARRSIGYLPQDFGFFRGFTLFDFVRYCGWLRGIPSKQLGQATAQAIEAVGLADQTKSTMKALSGGMVRRAGIASAIIGDPPLLLLDEPTVGLDPAQRLEFRNLIRSRRETAIVLSTHLVEDVAAVCDTVAVIDHGILRFCGTPTTLAEMGRPESPGDTPLERGYMSVLGCGTLEAVR